MTAAPPPPSGPTSRIFVPPVPILAVGRREAVLFSPDGELAPLDLAAAAKRARTERPMLCHLPAAAARLSIAPFPAHDVLELFAFVRPATFCLPTIRGLAEFCSLGRPDGLEEEARCLLEIVRILLSDIAKARGRGYAQARAIAWTMERGGWPWGRSILAALGAEGDAPHRTSMATGLRVWDSLPEISDYAPPPPSTHFPVEPVEARTRLATLLGTGAEDRPQQADYACACAAAFAPRETVGEPHVVLAEAGTGVGKTLGYIAPASVWAEKNDGPVWLSTYTRNLQRQLDTELSRLYPDPNTKARNVVVRKGRENYLCLLNLEEAVGRLSANPAQAVGLGLTVRWAAATRDGDMVGGDFPGWLADLIGRAATLSLMDQRGECVYAACPHYNRCFIERSIRRARRAKLVVANHALAMVVLAHGGTMAGPPDEEALLATRYVFDEGHHLFDAADSAFSAHLTAVETSDLRRWILGAEEQGRSRARGLKRRAEEIIAEDETALEALEGVLTAARCLPGPSWATRLTEGATHGPIERFLAVVRTQVYARAADTRGPYSLETDLFPLGTGLLEAAVEAQHALEVLIAPLKDLAKRLTAKLDTEADELDSTQRLRIESLVRSLDRRAIQPLSAWVSMLDAMIEPPTAKAEPNDAPAHFVDWLSVERLYGRDADIGAHRHWIDPTLPLARLLSRTAHGAIMTSATLRDGSGEPEQDWIAAEERTGGRHLAVPPIRAAVASPFRYPELTRVFIVTDVRKDDLDQVGAAYRELFLAAHGGGLGLFTAISRLREVHKRILPALDAQGLPLYAQHVDGMDTSTLIDIFRAEEDACLLGTDAVRDGVDVPGRSLRLIVFDRVPWPRPDILHRARREQFGGRAFDDRLTRLRLKQAFGRLVRRAEDHGVFVLLDPMMPSRLLGAFPDGVIVERIGLAEAVAKTRDFLA